MTIVSRNPELAGIEVLPRTWVLERTCAWLDRYRRLSKDYEGLPATAENLDPDRHD